MAVDEGEGGTLHLTGALDPFPSAGGWRPQPSRQPIHLTSIHVPLNPRRPCSPSFVPLPPVGHRPLSAACRNFSGLSVPIHLLADGLVLEETACRGCETHDGRRWRCVQDTTIAYQWARELCTTNPFDCLVYSELTSTFDDRSRDGSCRISQESSIYQRTIAKGLCTAQKPETLSLSGDCVAKRGQLCARDHQT